MNWPLILAVAALVLCVIEQFRTQGKSALVWIVTLLALALVWPAL